MWPRWLTDALSGKVSLARAFWLYGLGVSVAFSVIAAVIDIQNPLAVTIYFVLGVVVGVAQTVILWRSAYNSPSKFLGRVVRTAIVVGFIMVPLMLYLMYRYGLAAAS